MKTTKLARPIPLLAICIASLMLPISALATDTCVSPDDWRDPSIDLWVRADGALYSLDAGRWLEPDGASILDFIVDPTQEIELCFYFQENRGAARAWDEQDTLLATAKASDDPWFGVDCFKIQAAALGQVLELESGPRSITLTNTYLAPDLINGHPEVSTSSTQTQLRTLERSPNYDMVLSASDDGIFWEGNAIDGRTVEIEIEVGSALELCVAGGRRVALQVGDGPITELSRESCAEITYAGNGGKEVVVYTWVQDSSFYFFDEPNPNPPSYSAKIRIIKTCPS
jgi:hypothetical protein